MSTIRVDNFAPSAGGTEFPTEGVVKTASRFDMTINGLSNTINVSSATDNATGDSIINFTTSMAAGGAPTTYGSAAPTVSLFSESASSRRQAMFNLSGSAIDSVYSLHLVGDLV